MFSLADLKFNYTYDHIFQGRYTGILVHRILLNTHDPIMMLKLELFSMQILHADPRCTLTIMIVDWHLFFSVIWIYHVVSHKPELNGISILGPFCHTFIFRHCDSVSILFIKQLKIHMTETAWRLHSVA